MINPWVQFLISAVIVLYAGSRLTRNAAIVADNTGISTAWAGALMLPLATSLPELVTTIRAVSIEVPDMALGNILGSCLFNLALLSVIDLVEGRGALSIKISRGHLITASLSIITICLASIAMLGITSFSVGWIGVETLLIAVAYIFGSRLVFKYERKIITPLKPGEDLKRQRVKVNTKIAVTRFAAAAVLIIAGGVLLTDASDQIAVTTGLGHSFVGSVLLAVSTSLPEMTTTLSAVKLGYLDMAVANVFGANLFNFFIIFLADLVYRRGPLLYEVSDIHLMSSAVVVMMSTIFIFGIIYRSEKKIYRIGFDTFAILGCYLGALYLIFIFGGN